MNEGLRILPLLESDKRKRTNLSKIHQARMMREPFLYSAKQFAPEYLRMDYASTNGKNVPITPSSLLSQMTEKARNQTAFRKLCGGAMAIAPLLGVQWSEELEAALKEVEPELPPLEPIRADLLPSKKPRRSATETKKAVRK